MGLFRLGTASQALPIRALTFAAVLSAWLYACATVLAHALGNPQKISIALLLALIILPILLLNAARVPVYLLAAYGAAVPFTDVLATSAGPTYTNLLGIVTGGSLIFSMFLKGRFAAPSRSIGVLLALAVYMGATVFWAIDPTVALKSYVHYLSLIALCAVIALYPFTPNDLKVIIAGVIAGGILVAGYADVSFWPAQSGRLYLGSIEHSIDPNDLATSLLLPIGLGLALFLGARQGYAKFWWFLALFVLLTGFAAGGSRGATFGMGAICLFLLLRSQHRVQLLAAASAVVLFIASSPIGHRFMQSDVSNADGRFEVWRVGLTSLRQYWVAGAGLGNFNQAFQQYFLAVPHQAIAWDRVAHSILVGTAVELGIPGFLLTMALWYVSFRDLAHVHGDDVWTDISLGLRAGLLGIFVAGFSLSLMWLKYPWLTFALIAATRSMLTRHALRYAVKA